MRYVYEGNYPYLYAVDIYPTDTINAADKFIQLHDAMVREDTDGSLGFRDFGWIIRLDVLLVDPGQLFEIESRCRYVGITNLKQLDHLLDRK